MCIILKYLHNSGRLGVHGPDVDSCIELSLQTFKARERDCKLGSTSDVSTKTICIAKLACKVIVHCSSACSSEKGVGHNYREDVGRAHCEELLFELSVERL